MAAGRRALQAARTNPAGVSFADLKRLVAAAGFVLARREGSHHVYKKAGVAEIVNVQPRGRMAKPYQVRQVVGLIDKYRMTVE